MHSNPSAVFFMKHLALLVTCILVSATFFSSAGTITLEGTYQGKNIYVQNPFVQGGVGFCVYEVMVNGKPTTDEVNSSSFEIDLSALKLSVGEKVVIKINSKDDCKPKVVNPEDLKVRSTFEIVPQSAKVNNKDGIFQWTTKGENGKLPFVVEQYRWNKWVKVAEVPGKGKPEPTYYSIPYVPHSGENKLRVKQIDAIAPRVSEPVKYRSMTPEVKIENKDINKVDAEISFSDQTDYEIFDAFGNVMAKGRGAGVDVSNLKKGMYYINYDSKTGEKFSKK